MGEFSESGPDVLALQAPDGNTVPESRERESGNDTSLMVAPPKVEMTLQGARDFCSQRQESVVIRYASGDRIVAIVKVVSPGNSKKAAIECWPGCLDAGRVYWKNDSHREQRFIRTHKAIIP